MSVNVHNYGDADSETIAAIIAVQREEVKDQKSAILARAMALNTMRQELHLSADDHQSIATQRAELAKQTDEVSTLEASLDVLEVDLQSKRDSQMAKSITTANILDAKAIEEARRDLQQQMDQDADCNNEDDRALLAEQAVAKIHDTRRLVNLAGNYVSPEAGKALIVEARGQLTATWTLENTVPLDLPQRTCAACTDRKEYFEVTQVPCNHWYCRTCIHEHFENSFSDESLFPPRCCRQNITITSVDIFMTKELKDNFDEKNIEFNTANRTYCSNKPCNAFIKPQHIANNIGHCLECNTTTCTHCKNEAHTDECPQDPNLQAALELAQREGWRRCGRCQTMVELRLGCNHITCRCGFHFCYVCGASPWKSCRCEQWDEARLEERTGHVAARAGGNANVAVVREQLIARHNCDHPRWRGLSRWGM